MYNFFCMNENIFRGFIDLTVWIFELGAPWGTWATCMIEVMFLLLLTIWLYNTHNFFFAAPYSEISEIQKYPANISTTPNFFYIYKLQNVFIKNFLYNNITGFLTQYFWSIFWMSLEVN